jgi:hypothetical protein
MDEVIIVFSRKGIFQTTITARDVRSREHARTWSIAPWPTGRAWPVSIGVASCSPADATR